MNVHLAKIKPEIGQRIVVDLPGERLRAEVVEIRSDEEIVARLTLQNPMTKGAHRYKFGDDVHCNLRDGFAGKFWEADA